MIQALLIVFALGTIWLIRRDTARRDGISAAIWIPTLWVGILASRPLSTWVGFGGGEDTLEGSPVDRLFFLAMILAAFVALSRRRLATGELLVKNWVLLLFYAYLLVSVLWADSPIVSAKRWFKDFGNIIVGLVILTEANPAEAFRAVFVRCAYVLIPLSIVFIRYLPELGRRYSIYSGNMEATGVTFQKNSLGAMVVVCGLILLWDWIERTQRHGRRAGIIDRYLPLVVLTMGAWLLYISDSKTSILCAAIGAFILLATRMPVLRQHVSALAVYAVIVTVLFFAADGMFGISDSVISGLGRDRTFTGRTDVWRELLALNTDPIFGTGFCSFWSDKHYLARLPDWIASSAHNGYLEMYIDGGWLGAGLLGLLLVSTGLRASRLLARGDNYPVVLFAIFVVTVVGNFSESHFGRMSPLWFLFIVAATDASPLTERRSTRPFAALEVA